MSKHILVVCPNPAVDIYAHLDLFEVGIPNRITEEKRYPGGKGLHVGMALAELGFKVTIAGFWGGETGQWIKKSCNQYYPTIQFIGPELEEWTRSCFTFKSHSKFDDTEILGTGPTITNQDFENLIEAVQSSLDQVDYVTLSGSWPKGAPENGYASIIEHCHQANKPTMLDCTGIQLSNALQVKPTAVHLNRKEITEFYDCDFNEAKSRILISCEIAAITDGSKGLHLLTKDQSFHSLTKVDQVVSTIGSGDCLTAGVVAGLSQSMSLQEVANLGAACGAANCLREDLGMLMKSDVEMLLMQLAH